MKEFLSSREIIETKESINNIDTFAKIATYQHENMSLGWGALSGYASRTRDIRGENVNALGEIRACLEGAILAFKSTCNFIRQAKPFDSIYIFNGRFELAKAVHCAVLACSNGNAKHLIAHERGADIHKYSLYPGMSLFERTLQKPLIDNFWNASPDCELKKSLSAKWFEDRRNAVPREYFSFISLQQAGLIPCNLKSYKHNIAIYTSSEDEFQTLGGDWEERIYSTQLTGILRILKDSENMYPDTHFWIRMHPNSSACVDSETHRLRYLKGPNFTVIPPEGKVSTYALMDTVDAVLSFGSTAGIEASYWGKPSILAGPAVYEELDSCYVANSHDDVLQFLGSNLSPLPKIGAEKFGYFYSSFGETFRYWETRHLMTGGLFRGKTLITPPRRGIAKVVNSLAHRFGSRSFTCRWIGGTLEIIDSWRRLTKQCLGYKQENSRWSPIENIKWD
jgi:hypothetical protein